MQTNSRLCLTALDTALTLCITRRLSVNMLFCVILCAFSCNHQLMVIVTLRSGEYKSVDERNISTNASTQ